MLEQYVPSSLATLHAVPETGGGGGEHREQPDGELRGGREQGAEVDALVRARCERRRAGLEKARKWQCEMLAGAACALQ